MNETLIGLETEYAFTAYDDNGMPLDRARYCAEMVRLAAQSFPSMFGRDNYDLFLANGGRLYVDSGGSILNLEYSTPETTSPAQLVAHVRAGDRIMAALARELEAQAPQVRHVFVSKTNFDYSGHTSGSHENYLHTAPQAVLASQLVPHLATRIVYSGGGGFDSDSKRAKFMLSPRVCFLGEAVSTRGEQVRAIFSTRQETHSNSRYGRLHLVCGEGVRLGLSEYLRVGTTALIVRLVDAGLAPADGITLDALPAMNQVARDTGCAERVALIDGRKAGAIDVQRRYLERVEAQAGGPLLPDWAGTVCARWRATLDALEADPMRLAGKLDWPTKLGLYRAHVERQGHDWDRLSRRPASLPLRLHNSLFEFDVRFGDVADTGFHAELIRADEQAPGLVSNGDIERAQSTPPQTSRAKLRGKWIAQLAAQRRDKECNWGWIHDRKSGQSLRFDDPLATAEVSWQSGALHDRRRMSGLMTPRDLLLD